MEYDRVYAYKFQYICIPVDIVSELVFISVDETSGFNDVEVDVSDEALSVLDVEIVVIWIVVWGVEA